VQTDYFSFPLAQAAGHTGYLCLDNAFDRSNAGLIASALPTFATDHQTTSFVTSCFDDILSFNEGPEPGLRSFLFSFSEEASGHLRIHGDLSATAALILKSSQDDRVLACPLRVSRAALAPSNEDALIQSCRRWLQAVTCPPLVPHS